MKDALTSDILAIELADCLVRKGVPFREAHHISGSCVELAEREQVPMGELAFAQLRAVDGRFEEDAMDVFDYLKNLEAKSTQRGTSEKKIGRDQIADLRRLI